MILQFVLDFNFLTLSPIFSLPRDRDELWVTSQAACPAVLRKIMMGEEGKTCKCSNHWIPYVSDLEYDYFISNQMSFKEQVRVVCVLPSSQTKILLKTR